MGLFDSEGKGNSKPVTNSSASTTNSQTITNNVDNRVWNTLSDSGAITAAENIANNALGFGSDALKVVGSSVGDVLDVTKAINADSLKVLGALAQGSIDASRTLARDFAESTQKASQTAIQGFQTLAVQTTSTSDDRVERVAKYAVVGIALVMVLPALFRSFSGGGGKAVWA